MAKKGMSKIEKYGIIAIVVIGVFYLYLNKMYDPAAQSLEETRTKMQELTEEIDVLNVTPVDPTIGSEVQELETELKAITEEFERAMKENKASYNNDVTNRIIEADRFMLEFSVDPTVIDRYIYQPEKEKKDEESETLDLTDSFPWIGYNLELKGSFSEIISFIDSLKNLEHVVMIKTYSIARDGDTFDYVLTMDIMI